MLSYNYKVVSHSFLAQLRRMLSNGTNTMLNKNQTRLCASYFKIVTLVHGRGVNFNAFDISRALSWLDRSLSSDHIELSKGIVEEGDIHFSRKYCHCSLRVSDRSLYYIIFACVQLQAYYIHITLAVHPINCN